MPRLMLDEAEAQLGGLGDALIEARLIAGLLSSSSKEKERLLRNIEDLLCKALTNFNKLEVGEKED